MQRVNCMVRLGGDQRNTVQKTGVSPAEIVILNDIHGEGSVVEVKPTIMDKVSHAAERSRLRGIYGHHVVDRIFPGEYSRLPVSLKDIEPLDEDDFEEEGEGGEGDQGGVPGEGEPDEAAARRAAEAQRKRDARAKAKAEAEAKAKAEAGAEGEKTDGGAEGE